jgi:DNA invertase Pin-like site-specific DNA recombinase
MSVYSYTRTSEIEALDASTSIDTAIENESLRLHTFALSQGMTLSRSYVDESIKWTEDFQDRLRSKNLLSVLESGDIVMTCSIERIFSSCEDMLQTIELFRKLHVKLIVVELGEDITHKDFAPPFSRLLKIFHGLEKRRSTERIKAVKQSQRNKGRFLGGSRPFGYMIHSNGRLIENPMEQRVLKKIIAMKKKGKSLRAISSEVSTPMVPVSFKTVQRLLKRHENGTTAQLSQ